MEKTLTSIYLDPSHPASFGGVDAVYRAVKEKGKNKISRKQVQDWLSQLLWQHESTTQQDGRHVYFTAPQGMLGHTITMHDVTSPLL